MVMEASLETEALRADPEKDPEKAEAEPMQATRAAVESFILSLLDSLKV